MAQTERNRISLHKNDLVVVLTGRDAGKRGKVLVQGVNMVKKNKKVTYQGQRGAKEGGITHEEAPIDVSNVQLAVPDSKQAARVGYRYDEDGRKIRVARPSGKDI